MGHIDFHNNCLSCCICVVSEVALSKLLPTLIPGTLYHSLNEIKEDVDCWITFYIITRSDHFQESMAMAITSTNLVVCQIKSKLIDVKLREWDSQLFHDKSDYLAQKPDPVLIQ